MAIGSLIHRQRTVFLDINPIALQPVCLWKKRLLWETIAWRLAITAWPSLLSRVQ